MSRNEFICDCNVIHDGVVENTIKEMPKEENQNEKTGDQGSRVSTCSHADGGIGMWCCVADDDSGLL